jgi:hypothetical protein
MAEFQTPVVTSKQSGIEIDHENGRTLVTYRQLVVIEGDIPTADIYKLMGSQDKSVVTRFVKVAVKNMPALPTPEAPTQPMYWNGDAAAHQA